MNKKLFEPKYFEFPKQVKFLDLGDTQGEEIWHDGIAIDDSIICGDCGTVFDIVDHSFFETPSQAVSCFSFVSFLLFY